MRVQDGPTDFERLRELLDRHGADPRRWPKLERAGLIGLADRDASAGRLRAEAAALDRVLAAAPVHGRAQVAALSDRIMAAAAAKASSPVGSAQIHDPAERRGTARVAGWSFWRRAGGLSLPSAAALAASLLLGFYVGMNNLAPATLQQVAGIAQDEVETVQLATDYSQDWEVL